VALFDDILKDIGLGSSVAGEIKSIYDSYAAAKVTQIQSNAQKLANEAQAAIADNNALLARWQATDAIRRGHITENRTRLGTAQLKSTQRARMAANGIMLGGDSALRVLADTDILGEIDAMTNRENAEREAWAYRLQAQDFDNRAAILRNATVPIPDSTSSAVITSLLSSGSRVASLWDTWKN